MNAERIYSLPDTLKKLSNSVLNHHMTYDEISEALDIFERNYNKRCDGTNIYNAYAEKARAVEAKQRAYDSLPWYKKIFTFRPRKKFTCGISPRLYWEYKKILDCIEEARESLLKHQKEKCDD